MEAASSLNFSGFLALGILLFLASLIIFFISSVYKKALRKADFFEAFFEHIPQATFVVNNNERLVTINTKMSELTQKSLQQLYQKLWYDLFVPSENAIKIRHQLKKHRKGSFVLPLLDNAGNITLYQCIYFDLELEHKEYRAFSLIPLTEDFHALHL